ncbi:hypothetical protein QVD17_29632 [Tagetes erecta]|uniref:Kinesin-like protein n=1 Tax=Tagetes erecta TaxID=13708 RepID=A0AAD8NFA9_TARER|nr:hypothetical protein QVD17_29632 [Tagetes erecta]
MKRSASNDNFIEANFNNKWLQSAGLHHLYSSNPNLPPLQEFGFYGNNDVEGTKLNRNADPLTHSIGSRSSSFTKYGNVEQVSINELSPGVFDLHSFDTGLLTEVHSENNLNLLNQPSYGECHDNVKAYFVASKFANMSCGSTENNVYKSSLANKEKASNVAKIKVVVRKRPLNKKEIDKKEEDIISIDPNTCSLTVHESKVKVDLTEYVEKHGFVFDAVMDEDVTNDEVYSQTVEPIIPIIFQKTKATCFAYGQTGSGKTYTMQPLPLKASRDIFRLMHQTYRNQGFQLFVSFFEIYGGKVFDLLHDRKMLCMREDGKQQVCIVGLQEYHVSNVETIKELIVRGNSRRSTGTTGANEESSRSHAILQLAVKKLIDGNASKPPHLVGKLSFIDLAGSERGADTTDNDKQTRMEGAEINKSLLALKECIRALDNDQGHIPFRGSKLTEVLKDSFVGNSRTVMISCISPGSGSCEHTLNTLRYADRVKSLSKGGNSKKDLSSSTSNLRNSVALPVSSSTLTRFEDIIFENPQETNRFVWRKQTDKNSSSSSLTTEHMPIGRSTVYMPPTENYRSDYVGTDEEIMEDDFDYSMEVNEPNNISRFEKPVTQIKPIVEVNEKPVTQIKPIVEVNEKPVTQIKPIVEVNDDLTALLEIKPIVEVNEKPATQIKPIVEVNDDLTALLEEEENLLNTHRKQVQETMDIVNEEMNLLAEVDQPGNQLDDYVAIDAATYIITKEKRAFECQNELDFKKHTKRKGKNVITPIMCFFLFFPSSPVATETHTKPPAKHTQG